MSGRVTRRRSRNSEWTDWALCSDRPKGSCRDVRHEKEFSQLQVSVMINGPFMDARVLDCGCSFIMLPVRQSS